MRFRVKNSTIPPRYDFGLKSSLTHSSVTGSCRHKNRGHGPSTVTVTGEPRGKVHPPTAQEKAAGFVGAAKILCTGDKAVFNQPVNDGFKPFRIGPGGNSSASLTNNLFTMTDNHFDSSQAHGIVCHADRAGYPVRIKNLIHKKCSFVKVNENYAVA